MEEAHILGEVSRFDSHNLERISVCFNHARDPTCDVPTLRLRWATERLSRLSHDQSAQGDGLLTDARENSTFCRREQSQLWQLEPWQQAQVIIHQRLHAFCRPQQFAEFVEREEFEHFELEISRQSASICAQTKCVAVMKRLRLLSSSFRRHCGKLRRLQEAQTLQHSVGREIARNLISQSVQKTCKAYQNCMQSMRSGLGVHDKNEQQNFKAFKADFHTKPQLSSGIPVTIA